MGCDGVEVELEHVLGGGAHAGQRLEGQRAELPAVRGLVGRRVELVRVELLEDLRTRAEHRHVRAEPLVGAAADHVGAERGEVVPAVRRGVDGVDVHARADRVGGGDDPGQVRDGADRVRRGGHRDPLGALGQHRLDRARRQLQASPRPARRSAPSTPRALGRDHPRAHVGVVVQPRADDLVARREPAHDGRREAHRQRREARPEADARRARRRAASRTAARVDATSSSVSSACLNCPPWLAWQPERIQSAIASIALSTTWLPAGPVEPGPALAQRGEAIAVHRSETSCASSASCS